jgi:hypothetical protein
MGKKKRKGKMGDRTDAIRGWSECEKGVSAKAAGERFSTKPA